MEAPERRTEGAPTTFQLVDCDIHQHFPQGLHTLSPYLSNEWRKKLGVIMPRAEWASALPDAGFQIPRNDVYKSLDGSMRMEAMPADGSPPASSPRVVAEQLLDPLGIDRGILLSGSVLGLGAVPNHRTAAAIASATNDWLDHEWLQADDRYRGAIIAIPQDPVAAAAEVRRMADRPGVVEVLLLSDSHLMGEPHFNPLYEAAVECGLPIAVHPSGIEATYANGPKIGGVPWHHIEYHTCLTLPYQANAVSLIAHGTFEQFPSLRVVFKEVGVAWLLEIMWRMDKNWKGLRDEVPWVKRRPSEYMHDHFRFTTQPFLEPENRKHLHAFIEMVQLERLLMFATDFPHWDADDPRSVIRALPAYARDRVASQNAVELYGDRLH